MQKQCASGAEMSGYGLVRGSCFDVVSHDKGCTVYLVKPHDVLAVIEKGAGCFSHMPYVTSLGDPW